MDSKIVFVKTIKGDNEIKGKGGSLSGDLKRALFLIDDKATFDEISKKAPPSLREALPDVFRELVSGGYVRDKAKPFAEAQIVTPKIVTPTLSDELDFTNLASPPPANQSTARSSLEAAVEAAKTKARAEAEIKAAANAKLAADLDAKNKLEEANRAKQNAQIKAQAETKAKLEAEARVRAEQAASQAKIQLEAAAKVKLELEAAAKARAEAEAARIKAEQETARMKAELEIARAQAEAEAKALAELRAKQEAEAQRLKAEQEAARLKAEAEAKALAELRAKQEAEAQRLKAEQEAARLKAEAEAKALAELRAKQEAEAQRLKAEQEAARLKAEAEAEAEAKALAELRAKQEAEAQRLKAELEVTRLKAEAEAKALAAQRATQEAEAQRLKAEQEAARLKAEAEQEATQVKAESHHESDLARIAALKAEAEAEIAKHLADQEAKKLAEEQSKLWSAASQRAKEQANAESTHQASPFTAPSAVSSTQHKQARSIRKPLPLGKIMAGLVIFAMVGVVIAPLVMPLQSYIAPIEQKLSAQFKQPVHISSMKAALLPRPKIELNKVTLGEKQEIKINAAILTFDFATLFSDIKTLRDIELKEASLDAATVDKALTWLQELGNNKEYRLSHVTLSHPQLANTALTLPLLNGEIEINEQGKIGKLSLKSEDAKFDGFIQSSADSWQLSLNAKATALPILPNLQLDDFTAKGDISSSGINFNSIDIQAYGGFIQGKAQLNWRNGWQLQGQIEARTVELSKLFPQFGITGDLAGESKFLYSGLSINKLTDNRQMNGTFIAKKGVLSGMDVVETARQGNRQNASVGRTNFDELSGNFQLNGRGPHFQQVKIKSGILNGSGNFDVNADSQLSGRFAVELKSRVGTSTLTLTGSLTEPLLQIAR